MKRKVGLFFGLFLGLFAIGGVCVSVNCIANNENALIARAEDESSEVESSEAESLEPEVFECSVKLNEFEHGKIVVDKKEGHVGDLVTLTAKHDLFYLVDYVAVNGTNLVESEEVSGEYTFALVEGENVVSAKFVVDTKLLGEMSSIYEQASNKDWTHLFSVENVLRIVVFILNGGLLIAMVRYFIKDKKLARSIENNVRRSVEKVVPETTKQAVVANIKEVIEPLFAETVSYQQEIIRVVAVLVKCVALMQEDTPDAKRAILSELSNLNVGDQKVIDDAKETIEKFFNQKMEDLNNVLSGLDNIINKNKEVAEKTVEAIEMQDVEGDDKNSNRKQATE